MMVVTGIYIRTLKPCHQDLRAHVVPTGTSSISIKATYFYKMFSRSTMSSRGKRKEDRKKTDLKHGGKYEDIALMRALYIEITEAYEMWTEYNELLMFSDTVEDHNQMKVVRDRIFFTQSYMMLHSKEIWPKDMNNSLQSPESRLLWENLEHLGKMIVIVIY